MAGHCRGLWGGCVSYRWTSQRTAELEGSNRGILGSMISQSQHITIVILINVSIKGQGHLGNGIRNTKFGYRYNKTRTNVGKVIRGRLLLQEDTRVEKGECKGSKVGDQEPGKRIMRHADHVPAAVRGHLKGSPTFDHCSWSRIINQTPCADHTIRVEPAPMVRHARAGAAWVLPLPVQGAPGWMD